MASAQVAGNVKVFIRGRDGKEYPTPMQGNVYNFGPGGSADGTIANTPEKWNYLPPSAVTGGPGSCMVIKFTPGAAATLDISDAAWVIPVIVNGNVCTVGNPAHATGLGNDAFTNDYEIGDSALVATQESVLCVLRAKEGINWKLGGGKVFFSVENNA